jgi:predicted nucleic acid-binding Zn ribbon protein
MPVYTYRREDGTTFEYRQKFLDDPLTVDPETGQKVVRVVQAASVIFKGSGFYINDSKSASKSSVTSPAKSESKDETKSTESKSSETKATESKSTSVAPAAAAD